MALQLYNTRTRSTELFKPLKDNEVRMYSCGPTVYNYAHIGNFRAYIVADLLKRYLIFKGFRVKHVMNITDIDDKTIRDSQKEKKTLKEFTEFYALEFFKDLETLNIKKADIYPKATEHVNEMLNIIKRLKENDHTYESDGSVYYKIRTFEDYGELARLNLEELKENADGRLDSDEYEKEDARDFALWKGYTEDDGNIFYETEFGKGRPGWHIECSAMSSKYLGDQFDIHTGGVDLIFPHHTNEIAQSEGACRKHPFVNFWVHNEHLIVEGKKMSKSLGNFFTLRDILDKGYDKRAIRYLLLSTHYRQKLNFSFDGLEAAKKAIERIQELITKLNAVEKKDSASDAEKIADEMLKSFERSMDNDLNIGDAMTSVFDSVRKLNNEIVNISEEEAEYIVDSLKKIDSVIGIFDFKKDNIPEEIINIAEMRKSAKQDKDWTKADQLRDKLKEKGYSIADSKDGSYLIKKL